MRKRRMEKRKRKRGEDERAGKRMTSRNILMRRRNGGVGSRGEGEA